MVAASLCQFYVLFICGKTLKAISTCWKHCLYHSNGLVLQQLYFTQFDQFLWASVAKLECNPHSLISLKSQQANFIYLVIYSLIIIIFFVLCVWTYMNTSICACLCSCMHGFVSTVMVIICLTESVCFSRGSHLHYFLTVLFYHTFFFFSCITTFHSVDSSKDYVSDVWG